MKKGKHPTLNIPHSTPNHSETAVWRIHEGAVETRKLDLEDRLLEFASAVIDLYSFEHPNRKAELAEGSL
jgi:hypothetical protein